MGVKGMAKAERIERWRGVLDEIATDPEQHAGARVAAANSLLDRTEGKPRLDVDLRHHMPSAAAADADLLAIALSGGSLAAAQTDDQDKPGSVVH